MAKLLRILKHRWLDERDSARALGADALKRLEARPTSTMCIGCKEESERLEHVHIDGHRPKSLGRKLRLA
jgi:hypothetical protein